jgi:hypothetical protein
MLQIFLSYIYFSAKILNSVVYLHISVSYSERVTPANSDHSAIKVDWSKCMADWSAYHTWHREAGGAGGICQTRHAKKNLKHGIYYIWHRKGQYCDLLVKNYAHSTLWRYRRHQFLPRGKAFIPSYVTQKVTQWIIIIIFWTALNTGRLVQLALQ